MRTLIIDDDDDIREVMALVLQSGGNEVRTAATGLDGLQFLLSGSELPEVIVLDLMMPLMDGEAFLSAMRSHPELTRIPVIIISGHHEGALKARQLGSAACLIKPIELEALLSTVARVGGQARKGQV